MPVKSFDPDHWIGRMGASLSDFARKVIPVRITPSGVPVQDWGHYEPYSYEEYQRMAVESAKGDLDLREVFDRSHIGFDDEPVEVEALLREHPVISRALESSEQEQAVEVFRPGGWNAVELRTFVTYLIKLTFGFGGSGPPECCTGS